MRNYVAMVNTSHTDLSDIKTTHKTGNRISVSNRHLVRILPNSINQNNSSWQSQFHSPSPMQNTPSIASSVWI